MNALKKVQRRKPRRELHEHIGLRLSHGQIGGFIQWFVYDIEHYDSKEALDIIEGKSAKAEGFHAFVLGGTLKVIKHHGWYQEYGYLSFDEMVNKLLDFPKSVVQEYIELYEVLSREDIPWKKIRHLRWSQIIWYGKYLTPENADVWVAAVEEVGDEFCSDFKLPEGVNYEILTTSGRP